MLRSRLLPVLGVYLVVCISVAAQNLSDKKEYDQLRAHALELYKAQNFLGALPELRKLADQNPKDIPVVESLGFCLVTAAGSQSDPATREKTRAEARKYLEAAKELGDNSELLLFLLDKVKVDSAPVVFSENEELNRIIRQGEDEFAKGNLEAAKASYQQAVLLDPKSYFANLYLGDVYFKQKQYGSAVEWFQKAAEIDPSRDTAFRYWGDALAGMGRSAEARARFIDAVVAQPYSNNTWRHVQEWAHAQGSELTIPKITSPSSPNVQSDNKININIDASSLGANDGRSAWMMYSILRATWPTQQFKKEFPNEPTYRHSLKEESSSLAVVAASVKGDKKIKHLDPQLAMLVRIVDDGLLDPYVLLTAADNGIAQDYVEYRKTHRDLLYKYLDTMVVPAAKTPH